MKKRIVSMLLLFVMMVSLLAVSADAAVSSKPKKENEILPTCTEPGSYDMVTRNAKGRVIRSKHYVVAPLGHDEGICKVDAGAETVACARCGAVLMANRLDAPTVAERNASGEAEFRFFRSVRFKDGVELAYRFDLDQLAPYDEWMIEVTRIDGDEEETFCYGPDEENEVTVNGKYGKIVFGDLNACEMGHEIQMIFHGYDRDGNETAIVGDVCTVKDVLCNVLTDKNASDAMRKLCADILNYGGLTQVYFDMDADNPVNSGFTAEQQEAFNRFVSDPDKANLPADSYNCSGTGISFSLLLRNGIDVSIKATRQDSDNIEIRVFDHLTGERVCEDAEQEIETKTTQSGTTKHVCNMRMRVATVDYRRLYDVVVYVNGEEVSRVDGYSVAKNCKIIAARAEKADPAMARNVKAVVVMGDSCVAASN